MTSAIEKLYNKNCKYLVLRIYVSTNLLCELLHLWKTEIILTTCLNGVLTCGPPIMCQTPPILFLLIWSPGGRYKPLGESNFFNLDA